MRPKTTTITVRVDLELVRQLDALAERLSVGDSAASAPGERVTRTAAARLALRRGIVALDVAGIGQHPGQVAASVAHLPDAGEIDDAAEALGRLADVDLGSAHLKVIEALADLDVDMLRALRRLDVETLDALAAIDASHIEALDRLASGTLPDVLDRLADLS